MGGWTPGPWKVSVDGTRVYSATRTEWAVADAAPGNACAANITANARLIASAPELFEALEAMLAAELSGSGANMAKARHRARAAISRAHGEDIDGRGE